MKILKKENYGRQEVYNTNVDDVHNYIGSSVINHNCLIDESYQGEIHLNMINTSKENVRIYENMKMIQFIEVPILTSKLEEVDSLDNLYLGKSTRGDGGFGHTGK